MMLFKIMIWYLILESYVHLIKSMTKGSEYRNSFILHRKGHAGDDLKAEVLQMLSERGYKLEKQIVQGHYQFVRDDISKHTVVNKDIHIDELKQKDNMVVSFEQEVLLHRDLRSARKCRKQRSVNVTDANWLDQWYLNPDQTPSMRIYDAWDKGYTGRGVTVAVVDDGIDVTHIDLVANYDASRSFDYIYNLADPSHAYPDERHGTYCAGIIAATKNEHCVIGIAYEAKLPAIRLIDAVFGATASQEALALIHELDHIDIYSNSWGPIDDGKDFDEADTVSTIQEAALLHGVTMGRDGKGAIYMWAAGNGGFYSDDCNVDGYSSNMYTISITSLAPDTTPAWYTEECTAIMAATYGGDDAQDKIATTSPNDMCVDDFEGTSAACPVASGIMALVLQANQNLTWRDVQHLIVEYSTNTGLTNANFYSNAAGKKVSVSHGFGLLNAEAMVDAALTWQPVPRQESCVGATQYANKSAIGLNSTESTSIIDSCLIEYLEHVYIYVSFLAERRNHTSIFIVSPGGTESRILRQRINDTSTSPVTWRFLSVHTWGENPSGTWTLKMFSTVADNELHLDTWSLTFYGTVTDPLSATPDDEDDADNIAIKGVIVVGVIATATAIITGIAIATKGLLLKGGASVAPAVRHRQDTVSVAGQSGQIMSTNLELHPHRSVDSSRIVWT